LKKDVYSRKGEKGSTLYMQKNGKSSDKSSFSFPEFLSRPWYVKISLTDGPSCWIHLVKPWICGLSSINHTWWCGVRIIAPTARYSDSPLFRRTIIPIAHYSDGPFFRQCKIELNPQIHGLTRCIQRDGPVHTVRLILP
jgi:hypothetical protein